MALAAVCLVSGAAIAVPGVAAADSTLILSLVFEEGSGTIAADGSGNGNDADLRNGAGWGAGRVGGGLALDGVNDFASIDNSSSLGFANALTVAGWVNRTSVGSGWRQVVGRQLGKTGADQFYLAFKDGVPYFGLNTPNGGIQTTGSGTAAVGQWVHVAGVYDGARMRLYVNGVQRSSRAKSGNVVASVRPVLVGAGANGTDPLATSQHIAGGIDEVKLYARALSASEIGALANPVEPEPSSVTVAAAGDIACSPSSPSFNSGNGTATECRQRYTSDLLLDPGLDKVLTLGDNQYPQGSLTQFLGSYDLSWGRVKSITRPTTGNHEYQSGSAKGYFDYFNGVGVQNGPAGPRGKGYYSFDLGAWHLIALNSNCSIVACAEGSVQNDWLEADLAANAGECTLAYWHNPRFSSGSEHGDDPAVGPFWDDLYAAEAAIVLSGHDHSYERFAPQTPAGVADPDGIREFVVGTGGKSLKPFAAARPNSVVRNASTYGVLELTLRSDGYDWRFVPEAGEAFTDSGSGGC